MLVKRALDPGGNDIHTILADSKRELLGGVQARHFEELFELDVI